MKVPLEVRCLECRQIFCCAKCRRVHESISHSLGYDCPICHFQPWTGLKTSTMPAPDLLEHIASRHMPLACTRCGKSFRSMDDLKRESQCCCSKESPEESLIEAPEKSPVKKLRIVPKNRPRASSEPVMGSPKVLLMERRRRNDNVLMKKIVDKSEVMTSTPTHPTTPPWGLFHKSFTSTLSGIGSPDSDTIASPPADNQQVISSNQLSSIHSPTNDQLTEGSLKSIMSKSGSRSALKACDSSDEITSASSTKRKRVKFNLPDEPKRNNIFVFLKPKRVPTPGKMRPSNKRTTRIQAMINNYESRSTKLLTTPVNQRPIQYAPDETPQITDCNGAITARTINFKENDSPPLSSDIESPLNHYKSCISDDYDDKTDNNVFKEMNELPQQIAKSIQETLSHALDAQEGSTEIQLKIVITKRIVSVKETKRPADAIFQGQTSEISPPEEYTTVWSRLVNGLKWVVWGDKGNKNCQKATIQETPHMENIFMDLNVDPGSGKRKRLLCQQGDSPVSKRHRYEGRLRGRRPLDRIMREGIAFPERSFSSDLAAMEDDDATQGLRIAKDMLNKSF